MFSCLFSDNMAQDSATIENGCGSSVVEHSLGKGEVESSILSRSTIVFFLPIKSCPLSINLSPPNLHRLHSQPLSFRPCALMASKLMISMTRLASQTLCKISQTLCAQILTLTRQEQCPHSLHIFLLPCIPALGFMKNPLLLFTQASLLQKPVAFTLALLDLSRHFHFLNVFPLRGDPTYDMNPLSNK